MSEEKQLFSASLAKDAVYKTGLRSFMEYRDLGIEHATHGKFRAHTIRIKQDASIRDVPIIFLTAAVAQPEQAFRGYAAGAVDYLAKPFDPGVLKVKVSVFVDLYLKASQLREQAELLGGRPLTAQLSERLEAVEESLAALRALPAVSGDADTAETAARLAGRVGRLRDALDALDGDRA